MPATKTYPEMNARLVGILRTADEATCHYAAKRIEELEAEVGRLEARIPERADLLVAAATADNLATIEYRRYGAFRAVEVMAHRGLAKRLRQAANAEGGK